MIKLIKLRNNILFLNPQHFSFSSEKLLSYIHHFLKKNKIKLSSLQAIKLNNQPLASFTTLRAAVVVANTLAYVLKIPVNDKRFIEPLYGRPPNIT